jgi:hypothetical protein
MLFLISLYNYYREFKFIVNNDKEYSTLINTSYGVKQGGNVSPALYKIYTETIAEEIENPFGTDANDLPLDEISKNIRKSVEMVFEERL